MQQVVMPFDGSTVEVIKNEQGEPFVSVRSVCQAIGIAPNNQVEKIRNDSRFMRYDIISRDNTGRPQTVVCIPLSQLNGWLFSINPNKVPGHIGPKLIAYQQECFDVLYKHFMPRGELDLQPMMDKLCSIHDELKHIRGATDTVFGDDKDEIQTLVQQVSELYKVDGRTVWGWIQSELDVQSYKRQNRKIINFLRNKLGKGLVLVKEGQSE